ncbi:MAG: DUF4154 domain-containing protein [Methyloprofundus sp.]|nr:DUF4154 domain-containing protein [Methyloprofundus sp.]
MMPVTRKILATLCCLLLFFGSINQLWARSVEKQTVLAVLTLNVARFTTWPEQIFQKTGAVLNLCVIGNNIVQQSFVSINNKVINNKTIHIINLSRLRNLRQCQLLYVSDLERKRLIPLLAELRGQAILTIGESIEFLQAGGMVGLEKVNDKMQLNINLPIVKQSGLVISSRLLRLANIVDFPYTEH